MRKPGNFCLGERDGRNRPGSDADAMANGSQAPGDDCVTWAFTIPALTPNRR